MKNYSTLKTVVSLVATLFLITCVNAQQTPNYVLLPGDTCMMMEGATQDLTILWFETNGVVRKGISDFLVSSPIWYINGKPFNQADPKEGKLVMDPTLAHPTYTAPEGQPPLNPVNISVRFKANDSSKEMTILICNVRVIAPKNKWFISFTCSKYDYKSKTSAEEEYVEESHASGSASMVVDAPPPDPSGQVNFSTGEGGNKLIDYTVSGNWSYHSSDITKSINTIVEKTIRDYTGTPFRRQGIEFEYAPSPGGGAGLNAGIAFNQRGTDKFWKWDSNAFKLKLVDTNDATSESGTTLGVGSNNMHKTKNGFTFDYSESKDTTYTILGEKNVLQSGMQYHATVSYEKEKKHTPAKKG